MGAADAGLPLQGVRVLVTRPAAQAQSLAQRIEQAGGESIRCPALEIAATRDVATLERVLAGIAHFDLAVFISPNAVAHGLAHLKMHGGLPARLTIAAIGRSTARALTEAGIVNPITPVDGSDPATAPGVALGGCSRRRSTSFFPEVVPPPSLESSEALLARP